jgi:hypothetical protein
MPGMIPEGAAPPIPDWYKVGWRAHAGIDDPVPSEEERDKGILEQWLTEMYYGDWYHSKYTCITLTCSHNLCYI